MPNLGVFYEGPKKRADRAKLLIVEGADDAEFFDKLLIEEGANPDAVGLIYLEGKTKLRAGLQNLARSRFFTEGGVERIWIVQDADVDPQAALASIQSDLVAEGLVTSTIDGFLSSRPQIGISLLPSHNEVGDLEKVCLGTIPDDPAQIKASQFFTDAEAEFGPFSHPNKRRAAIFLALSHVETRGVGNAFKKGSVFDSTHPSLASIKSVLRSFLS